MGRSNYNNQEATTKLVSENTVIQQLTEKTMLEGAHITACRECADQLDITEFLKGLNIEVIHQTGPFTNILKDEEKLLII